MTKSLPLIGSLMLNFLLALWLINNYFYDQPFKNYVDLTLGQIGPYLILTLGVGGGSSLGYIFLKRKHPIDQGISSKLPKSRFPRPRFPSATTEPSGLSQAGKNMPSGAAPSQIPKHVAYAVPPAISSKSGSPSVSKQSTPTLSWSASSKPAGSPQLGPGQSQPQLLRREMPTPSSSSPTISQGKVESSPPSLVPRQATPPWRPESQSTDRKPDLTRPFPKPGTEFPARSQPTASPQQTPRPLQGASEKSTPGTVFSPVPQKWQPQPQNQPGFTQPLPPQTSGQQQQRPDFDSSQKWQPVRPYGQPQTSPVPQPQQRPLPPGASTPPGNPMRPPPGPFTARPLPPGAPRPPQSYQQMPGQGQTRPGVLGPVGVPRQFRPEPGPSQLPPSQNAPRPMASNQWTPSQGAGPSGERPTLSSRPQSLDSQQVRREPLSQRLPEETTASETGQSSTEPATGAGGSDMDWDTALDTILKTLRRDRIRDEQ